MFPCKATLYLAPIHDEEYTDRYVGTAVCVCVY